MLIDLDKCKDITLLRRSVEEGSQE